MDDDLSFSFASPEPSVSRLPLKISNRSERSIKRLSSKTTIVQKEHWVGHINHFETEAQLLADRHMDCCPFTGGHRLITMVGNISTFGEISKGGSSSFALKNAYRKIAGLLLSFNITQLHH